MKALKFLTIIFLMVAFTITVQAQVGTPLYARTTTGKLVKVGQFNTKTTTDSTLTIMDTVAISDNSAGLIEVAVVGLDSLGNGVTGKQIYRYHKAAGTLTLASATNISTAVTDAGLGTATYTFTATSSNNAQLKIKGKLTYTVHWRSQILHTTPN